MKTKRVYTAEQKAEAMAALDACGGNPNEASKVCSIPESTIRFWAAKEGKLAGRNVNASLRDQKRSDLAGSLEEIAWKLIKAAKQKDKIEKASLSQIMVGIGIAVEKLKLLRAAAPQAPAASEGRTITIGKDVIDLDRLDDTQKRQFLAIIEASRPLPLPAPNPNSTD